MLQINDVIVYENGGVYKIEDITSLDFASTEELYYKLVPVMELTGTIYLKTNNDKIQYRKILSQEEAEQYLQEVEHDKGLYNENDKVREKEYREVVRSCACKECLRMFKGIVLQQNRKISAGKKLNNNDEKNLKKVGKLLHTEFALVFNITVSQAQDKINKMLL